MHTEKSPSTHGKGCSNFDRAVTRMSNQGFKPFCPDTHLAASKRWLRDAEPHPSVQHSAARADMLIAAFALGVALGMMIP